MNRLNVGDVITQHSWDTDYKVLEILPGVDNYKLLHKKYNVVVSRWHYSKTLTGLQIKLKNGSTKSDIEQKIAFMYQRFEKRNEELTW